MKTVVRCDSNVPVLSELANENLVLRSVSDEGKSRTVGGRLEEKKFVG